MESSHQTWWPGPDSIGIVAISHGCTGVATRACGLVGLEPTRVAEILKDRPSWYRDCRAVDVLNVLPTANGGTIELLYMQLYAPTTLAAARDFCLLRYTSVMEDGSLVVSGSSSLLIQCLFNCSPSSYCS
ncbi:homeobox-leucine zipper protein ATHB-15-like [Camellia sinensis]|uniref:homeobox-leucine zipper protein ATHB-15-like n=1 Tax=Camellia sinensis TaxID=4442 RepID=UPI001035735F|nr:homeobox-leucine zipper protein ATHB-15-like [Camellia sinensis]